ncbi:MAG: NlpC/P60 family protein [Ilumatobacteraceae bacterium]
MSNPLRTRSFAAWLTRPKVFVVALTLVVGGAYPAFSSPARAVPDKRIPESTEKVISSTAIQALNALNQFMINGNQDSFDLYRVYANQLAIPIAGALGLDANELQLSWARADLPHQRALIAGLTQIGVPYRFNSSVAFKSFDCSGLTFYAWGVSGINVARSSAAQFYRARGINEKQAQPGDLVWRPGHVALYLGVPGAVLQAPDRGRNVEIQLMNERISSWVRYADPLE